MRIVKIKIHGVCHSLESGQIPCKTRLSPTRKSALIGCTDHQKGQFDGRSPDLRLKDAKLTFPVFQWYLSSLIAYSYGHSNGFDLKFDLTIFPFHLDQ